MSITLYYLQWTNIHGLLTGVFRGSPAPVGGVPAERDLQQAIQSKKSILITGMPRLAPKTGSSLGGEHHLSLFFFDF